jgi:catechol 2,3-dioxygenase-like lactoylglutathione lyase family enzyme
MRLTHAPLVVPDQEKALAFYRDVLGWEVRQDVRQPGKGRWLTVAPPGQALEFALVEGKADVDLGPLPPEAGSGGLQWAFATDDARGDFERLQARGVDFHVGAYTKPVKQFWGTSATFRAPDGNLFALVQQNAVGRMFVSMMRRKASKQARKQAEQAEREVVA